MKRLSVVGFLVHLVLMTLWLLSTSAESDISATVTRKDGNDTTFVGKADFEKSIASFFGIRYGQPRVEEERFQRSSMYEYTENEVSAEKHGNVCPQAREFNSLIRDDDKMGEDCLFLNILVPLDARSRQQPGTGVLEFAKKKAVYIFIHGGVFVRGSSNLYVTKDFVTTGDFIAVTLNYRLGVFGFLSTDDDVMPANLGLWDQQMAIRWVKQNIDRFGGDSSRITVGGQSAGSMSAILQSFYDGNDGLFQNTIAESGSPFTVKIVAEKGLPTALEVAKMAGCKLSSKKKDGKELSKEVIKCLKKKTMSELADLKMPKSPIGPVLDNEFITRETFELCPQGIERFTVPKSVSSNFANKNLLVGYNAHDGEIVLSLALDQFANDFKIHERNDFLGKPISYSMLGYLLNRFLANKYDNPAVTNATVNAIMEYYTYWSKPSNFEVASMKAVDLMTDYYFANPTYHTALLHSHANTCSRLNSSNCGNKTRPTYFYEFSLPQNTSLSKFNSDFPWFDGTRHGAELFLLSDYPLKNGFPKLTHSLVTAWTNFIKTGNPNSAGSDEWKSFTEDTTMYELSRDTRPTNAKDFLAKRVHFWDSYLPGLQDSFRSLLKTDCSPPPSVPSPATKAKHHDKGNGGGVTTGLGKYVIVFTVSLNLVFFKL